MRATPPLPLALLVLLLTLSGCGGSDSGGSASDPEPSTSSTALDADFVARADGVCERYATWAAEHGFPVKGFNRYAPDAELLPAVADYLASIPAYQDLTGELEDLGDPDGGLDAWASVLDDLQTNADDLQAEIEAARQQDVDAFPDAVRTLEDDTRAMFADLVAAGLGDTTCTKAEADPLNTPEQG
jgi:hypothetical protein